MKHSLIVEGLNHKIKETEYRPVLFSKVLSPLESTNIGGVSYRNFLGTGIKTVKMSEFKDHGRKPYVVNIEDATVEHDKFRTALWTGNFIQMTLMSIPVGGDVGLEIHNDTDQFLRLEKGHALVQMGLQKNNLDFEHKVTDDWVILVPSGYWHNVTNIGNEPLNIYSIYGPPHHKYGTVHETQEDDIE